MNAVNPNCLHEVQTLFFLYSCDYGTWEMTKLVVIASIDQRFHVNASMIPTNLYKYARDLSDGIDIKRAYKCVKEHGEDITIPLEEISVAHYHNGSDVHSGPWRAEIRFFEIQVQPFLVFSEHFNDPYLCK